MPRIATIETGFYRIPLPVTLSDSTHGEIAAFELITCRIRDADGAEGVGYTYTVGRNGGAVADILKREIPPLVEGRRFQIAEEDLAGRGAIDRSDEVEERRFPAARRSHQYGKVARGDLQRDVIEHLHGSRFVARSVDVADVLEGDVHLGLGSSVVGLSGLSELRS